MELQMMCYVNERNIIMFKRNVVRMLLGSGVLALVLAVGGIGLGGNAPQVAYAAPVNIVGNGGEQIDPEPNGSGGGCAECNEN